MFKSMNFSRKTLTIIPVILLVLMTFILHVGAITSLSEYNSIQNLKKTFIVTKQNENSIPKTFVSDFQKFVEETNSRIESNKKQFAELRMYLVGEKSQNERKINTLEFLEIKNMQLKSDLDNYVMDGNGNWKLIRDKFTADLKKLDSIYTNMLQLTAENIN